MRTTRLLAFPDSLRFGLTSSTTMIGLAIFGLGPLVGWALARERWFILAGLGVVALLPVAVRWPVCGFGLYAFFATALDAFPLLPGGASLTKPLGVLAGAVLLASGLIERRLVRPSWAALLWGLLILWGMLSVTWAVDTTLVTARLPTVLSLYFLYVVATSFRPSQGELYSVCACTVLGGVLAATLAYVFGLDDGAGRGRLVLAGMDSNPNGLGRVLLLPLALAIGGVIGLRGKVQKAAAAASVLCIGAGIFISMSRGALVALVAMLGVLLYRTRARIQIIAIIGLLVLLTAAMPSAFYERIESVISGEDATGAGRTEIWGTGFTALWRFGIFGAGLDNFVEAYKLYDVFPRSTGAHNVYLMIWVELGVIGLALMLAAIGAQLVDARAARKTGLYSVTLAAAEAGCIGLLTTAIFGDIVWTKVFWVAWVLLTWSTSSERRLPEVSEARLPVSRA
jgi:O-antigen ligase